MNFTKQLKKDFDNLFNFNNKDYEMIGIKITDTNIIRKENDFLGRNVYICSSKGEYKVGMDLIPFNVEYRYKDNYIQVIQVILLKEIFSPETFEEDILINIEASKDLIEELDFLIEDIGE